MTFVTSVRVEKSSGPHEYVSVWIRGQSVGTLCVGKGDGDALRALLLDYAGQAVKHFASDPRGAAILGSRIDAQRPREPDDEVFAAPPRHAMTEKLVVREATDAEQLAALRAVVDPRYKGKP